MKRIGNRDRNRVAKDRRGFSERNAMFFQIARGLVLVPLELNHAFILPVHDEAHREIKQGVESLF